MVYNPVLNVYANVYGTFEVENATINLNRIVGMANNATVTFGEVSTISGNEDTRTFYVNNGVKVNNADQVSGKTYVYFESGIGADNAGGFLLQ